MLLTEASKMYFLKTLYCKTNKLDYEIHFHMPIISTYPICYQEHNQDFAKKA